MPPLYTHAPAMREDDRLGIEGNSLRTRRSSQTVPSKGGGSGRDRSFWWKGPARGDHQARQVKKKGGLSTMTRNRRGGKNGSGGCVRERFRGSGKKVPLNLYCTEKNKKKQENKTQAPSSMQPQVRRGQPLFYCERKTDSKPDETRSLRKNERHVQSR